MAESFPVGKSFHSADEEEYVLPCSSQQAPAPVIAIPLPNGVNAQHHYSSYPPTNDRFDDDAANNSTIPLAPTLITYDDNGPEAQNRDTVHKTRLGEDIGRVKGWTEKQQIKAANYHSKVKPEIERMRIINASDVARQRVVEGLEVKEDRYFNQEEWIKREKEKRGYNKDQHERQDKGKTGPSGYELKEYDVSDYTGYEYDSSYQYKSIYE